MENESSTKLYELTFVQACPTLEATKQKTALSTKPLTLTNKILSEPQKRLVNEKLKLHTVQGGHVVDFDCLVPVPVVLESASPRNSSFA